MYESHFISSKWSRWLARRKRPFVCSRWLKWLEQQNQNSTGSIIQPGGPVVSLTTFELRWERVFYTLESIGSGRLKPSRIILWVTSSVLNMGIPEPLVRLQNRGLEIRTCEDFGPHKKYFPLVNYLESAEAFVTCDDDVLYPIDWLERLVAAYKKQPDCVLAHCARKIQLGSDSTLAAYKQWPHTQSDIPDFSNIAIGMGGVIYPPAMFSALRDAGNQFQSCCPRADDIWLKVISLRADIKVCQVSNLRLFLIEVPGSRESGLARSNVNSGGNDEQIKATFSEADRKKLVADYHS